MAYLHMDHHLRQFGVWRPSETAEESSFGVIWEESPHLATCAAWGKGLAIGGILSWGRHLARS